MRGRGEQKGNNKTRNKAPTTSVVCKHKFGLANGKQNWKHWGGGEVEMHQSLRSAYSPSGLEGSRVTWGTVDLISRSSDPQT